MQTTDLDELKQLVAELRAEHMAQKEKERKERWTRYVSLSMVVIAVLAAIATLKGGGLPLKAAAGFDDRADGSNSSRSSTIFPLVGSIISNGFFIARAYHRRQPMTECSGLS